jgi:hypothetical protein
VLITFFDELIQFLNDFPNSLNFFQNSKVHLNSKNIHYIPQYLPNNLGYVILTSGCGLLV